MEEMNKTYSQLLMEASEAKGKLEGILEGKLEIAKGLIGQMGSLQISKITGLPLQQVEELELNPI